jgi:hypothetical protein
MIIKTIVTGNRRRSIGRRISLWGMLVKKLLNELGNCLIFSTRLKGEVIFLIRG